MNNWVRKTRFLCAVICLLISIAGIASSADLDGGKVLILYDSTGPYAWTGKIHSQQLASLIGHFQLPYTRLPIEQFRNTKLDDYAATFYLGTRYNNTLPASFLQQVAVSAKPICWFKYNIWELGDTKQFGFQFQKLDQTGHPLIHFHGQTFGKYAADPELGLLSITDKSKTTTVATACNESNQCVPYIIRGKNLWYIADVPFSYMSDDSRYVPFCEILHDILQINHPKNRRAMIRIEDVNALTDPKSLRAITDYLFSQGVPFAISLIPVYNDSRGYYHGGVPAVISIADKPDLVAELKYATSHGGSIILHGYTHQYRSELNPFTGTTGDDFEFFRMTLDSTGNTVINRPVPEDSADWARGRVKAALAELQRAGLSTDIWETPHYAASATDYKVFAAMFKATTQRIIYFPHSPQPKPGSGQVPYFAGQFFPYLIYRDVYGQKVIPENLGNVTPGVRLPADMIRAARKNLVVRDGWASAFFHPYLNISYLKQIVSGIKKLGYKFVPVSSSVQ